MAGFLARVAGLFRDERKAGSIIDSIPEFLRYGGSKSGVSVSWRNALEVSTVLAATRVISNGIAQVPIQFLGVDAAGNRTPILSHPVLDVLARRPNRWQTSFQFRQTLMAHLLLTGNAFVFVNRVGPERRISELVPIAPGRVTVYRGTDGTLEYVVTAEAPEQSGLGAAAPELTTGSQRRFPAEAIWHLRGLSWNSWMGLEIVKLAREAIGLAIATEATHSKLHANGAKPGGLYSVEGKLNAEQYKQISAWLDASTNGDNAWRPLVLDNGAKWTPLQSKGVDTEHLDTRKFQIEEVCRALGVIPLMVGASDKTATYASSEQMFIAHVVHTLSPWARNFEESAQAALLGEDERVDIELNFNALMRGAAKDRGDYNAKALGSGGAPGWMTPNEVRRAEGLPPIAGGDELPKPPGTAPAAPSSDAVDDDAAEDDAADGEQDT
jgi:HK97 family phage portal protein